MLLHIVLPYIAFGLTYPILMVLLIVYWPGSLCLNHVRASVPVNEFRLLVVKEATARDPALTRLKNGILDGRTNEKCDVSNSVRPYSSYRDELSVQDGVVVRGARMIIPSPMRSEVKKKYMPATWASILVYGEHLK